jgi:hypothetical protein
VNVNLIFLKLTLKLKFAIVIFKNLKVNFFQSKYSLIRKDWEGEGEINFKKNKKFKLKTLLNQECSYKCEKCSKSADNCTKCSSPTRNSSNKCECNNGKDDVETATCVSPIKLMFNKSI